MNAQVRPAPCVAGNRSRFRGAVVAHFAGDITVTDEHALREHLPACPACRRLYSRHLVLARTDPRGLIARDRLGRGLGLRGTSARTWRGLSVRLAFAAPAFALLVIVCVGRWGRTPSASHPDAAFGVRGGAGQVAAPSVLTYRIPRGGAPRLMAGAVSADDELAFAYANPGAWPYLLIFAVDEHAHVYWYHPAWTMGAPPPAAIAARPGAGPFELPLALRHGFDGRRLVLYAVFARQPLGVEAIERAARKAGADGDLALAGDLTIVRRTLEVLP